MSSKIGHTQYNRRDTWITVALSVTFIVLLILIVVFSRPHVSSANSDTPVLPERKIPEDMKIIPLNYANSVMTFCFDNRRVWVSTYGGITVERECQ